MIMRSLAACLCLLFAVSVHGPGRAAPAAWVVRDADTQITLFGTIHALPAGTDWLAPAVAARLDAADTLVVEAVIPDDPAVLAPMVTRLGTATAGKPLAARLPRASRERLRRLVAETGVPMATLDGMKTWLAAITLADASLAKAGISAANGVEPALLARARAAAKPIIGLETAAEQLGFLDGLPEVDQRIMLAATIDDAATARADADAALALWQKGDVDGIARDLAEEAKASPTLRRVLLTDRNRRWADWVVGVMKRPGAVFVAVGAAHLGGPDGLLAMLKARGLVVERVG